MAAVKHGEVTDPLLINTDLSVNAEATTLSLSGITRYLRGVTRTSWLVLLAVVLNALGGVMQSISIGWWFQSFNSDSMGAYPILVISSLIYVVIFGTWFLYIWFRYYRGKIAFSKLFGFPTEFSTLTRSGFWLLIWIGFNDAFNGVLTVTSSPPNRTPPVYLALLGGTTVIWAVLFQRYYTRDVKSISEFGHDTFIAVLLVLTSIYLSLTPTFECGNDQQSEPSNQIWFWAFITFISVVPGTLYNAQQQSFCKLHNTEEVVDAMHAALLEHQQHDKGAEWAKSHIKIFTLLVGCFFQLVFMLFFFWVLLIPSSTTLDWQGIKADDLTQQLRDGFGCFFGGGTSTCDRGWNTLYGLMFNTGYTVTYVASIYLNTVDLTLSMISGQTAGPLAALALILFPSWDLNNSGTMASIVLPSLFLQLVALTLYAITVSKRKVPQP